jgi:hypothetical protein
MAPNEAALTQSDMARSFASRFARELVWLSLAGKTQRMRAASPSADKRLCGGSGRTAEGDGAWAVEWLRTDDDRDRLMSERSVSTGRRMVRGEYP